jgi:hypothetical protein
MKDQALSPLKPAPHTRMVTWVTLVRASLVFLLAGTLNASPAPVDSHIQGRVVDQSGLALPGVSVRLTVAPTTVTPTSSGANVNNPALPASTTPAAQTAVSAGDGSFGFDVPAGRYRLDAELDGFQTVSRAVDASGSTSLPDLVMALGRFAAETTVVATPTTEVQPKTFGAPVTIAAQVIENAPTRNNSYQDMLPLVPNVVRGPDGLVSVAGARAPQGVVLVNSVLASDVATGDPVAVVPLAAVDNVQVITTGFPAEYGLSTGGVTTINSRSGGDSFKVEVNSLDPRPRLSDGGIHGLEAWEPNSSVRGPIVKGRAWFAQSFDYHWEKTRQDTVNGTQDRRQHGYTSFSQVDVKTSDRRTETAWVNARDEHVDGDHLGAFTPLGTVPDVDRAAVHGAFVDRLALGLSTVETRVGARRDTASLWPAEQGAYLVGHDLTRGGYFGTTDRRAWSVGATSVYSRALTHHLLKVGVSFERRQLDGSEQNSRVTYLWSDLRPAQTVDFAGAGAYRGRSTVVGTFVQDAWDVRPAVRVDLGVRLDHDSAADTVASPRAGVTWSATPKITVTAGAGFFASEVPLTALAFTGYQSRQVAHYDESGALVGTPATYWNRSADLSFGRARIWSARVDWHLNREWQLRTGVQERRGTHELIVSPVGAGGEAEALLSATGESRTRSFEATVGFRPADRPHQVYVSYVRSSSHGNTNDFAQFEGLFTEPRLEAAETAPLPANVPHRLLAWGVFSLPGRVTVAPFLDIRSGFPYSSVNDDWTYTRPRYSQRYPTFASLDIVVNKIVTLPKGARARIGFKVYNLAGHGNGREVQADIARSDFGSTYNPLGRQLRGVFEIIWSGSKKH